MPSSAYPATLEKLLLKECPTPGLVSRVWPRILPLLMRAYSDTYPLSDAAALDAGSTAQAIASALSTKVDRVRFVSMSSQDPLGDITEEDLFNHTHRSLETNRRAAFQAISAMRNKPKFLIKYVDEIGSPLIDTVFADHLENLRKMDYEIAVMTCMIPTAFSTFLIAHLTIGDEKAVDEMLPFAELLLEALPIGEPFAEPGTWIVATK